jgi:polyisoprenoid-binding protein YceI
MNEPSDGVAASMLGQMVVASPDEPCSGRTKDSHRNGVGGSARLRERSIDARTRARAALLLLAFAAFPSGFLLGQEVSSEWTIVTSESRLAIHVLPAGLLSSALHAHHFQPGKWSGELSWDPGHPMSVRVDVRIAADSLRDQQPKLSAKDIAKVEEQARGPAILDAAKYPQIAFEARQLEGAELPAGGNGEFRATLAGTLTLHGRARPLSFPIQGHVAAGRLEATAKATFRQSDFGIKPYKTALGTIAVADEITVEISMVAIPRDRHDSGQSPRPRD